LEGGRTASGQGEEIGVTGRRQSRGDVVELGERERSRWRGVDLEETPVAGQGGVEAAAPVDAVEPRRDICREIKTIALHLKVIP
jgi:hypothetical protein